MWGMRPRATVARTRAAELRLFAPAPGECLQGGLTRGLVAVGRSAAFVVAVSYGPHPRRARGCAIGQHDVPDHSVLDEDIVVVTSLHRPPKNEIGHGVTM